MPRTARPCATHGCPELTDGRRCDRHALERGRSVATMRGSSTRRGYDAKHRKWRKRVLAKDPLCVHCLPDGRVTPSIIADHIVPIRDGGARFDLNNGQGLCQTHHNRKTARER